MSAHRQQPTPYLYHVSTPATVPIILRDGFQDRRATKGFADLVMHRSPRGVGFVNL